MRNRDQSCRKKKRRNSETARGVEAISKELFLLVIQDSDDSFVSTSRLIQGCWSNVWVFAMDIGRKSN